MNNKMQDISKKKRTVTALLEIIVPSENEEAEVEEIKNGLYRLGGDEIRLLERLRIPSEMII